MSKPTPQKPLSAADTAAVQSFFSGPRATERVNAFAGWMIASGKYCPAIADEIRNFFRFHLDSKP